MQPSTNGQPKRVLEKYTDENTPTVKAPPLPPYSYPPPLDPSWKASFWRVTVEMALTFSMFLYVCCCVLAFVYFKDSWYRDEFSQAAVLEGLAILVTGFGIGVGVERLRRRRRKD